MEVPKGLNQYDGNKVFKLNKAIYGLKQAARCWFEVFESTFKHFGFQKLEVDRCIYKYYKYYIYKYYYMLTMW